MALLIRLLMKKDILFIYKCFISKQFHLLSFLMLSPVVSRSMLITSYMKHICIIYLFSAWSTLSVGCKDLWRLPVIFVTGNNICLVIQFDAGSRSGFDRIRASRAWYKQIAIGCRNLARRSHGSLSTFSFHWCCFALNHWAISRLFFFKIIFPFFFFISPGRWAAVYIDLKIAIHMMGTR